MRNASGLSPVKNSVFLALLVAQATVLHYFENFILIPLPVPGVKIGLANIISLLALLILGFRAALQVNILRIFLGSLLSGSFLNFGFLMSFSGGMTAMLTMGILFKKSQDFSPLGLGIAGAVAHGLGQLIMASFIIKSLNIFYYLPFMLLLSIPTGLLTGFLAKRALRIVGLDSLTPGSY